MSKKPKWKLFPGEKSAPPHLPAKTTVNEIKEKIAAADQKLIRQSLAFWEVVSHADSPAGQKEEAQKLTAAGWTLHRGRWQKGGVEILSEAGFHLDRRSHSLHERNCSLRTLARIADGLSGEALPPLWAAFLAGVKHAENQVYETREDGGRPSTREAVGGALLQAWKRWRTNTKTHEQPKAMELWEHYHAVCSDHGAPAFKNSRTFENRVSEWLATREPI